MADYKVLKGTFGTTHQLVRDGVVVDTYCPWNGDTRPDWMPKDTNNEG